MLGNPPTQQPLPLQNSFQWSIYNQKKNKPDLTTAFDSADDVTTKKKGQKKRNKADLTKTIEYDFSKSNEVAGIDFNLEAQKLLNNYISRRGIHGRISDGAKGWFEIRLRPKCYRRI